VESVTASSGAVSVERDSDGNVVTTRETAENDWDDLDDLSE
jgi:hypothetical protein